MVVGSNVDVTSPKRTVLLVDESLLTGRTSTLGELLVLLQDRSGSAKGRLLLLITLGERGGATHSLAVVGLSLLVLALGV